MLFVAIQWSILPGHYEPGILVVELFHTLCSSERVVDKVICKDDVTNALLAPISAWLDGSSVSLDDIHIITSHHTFIESPKSLFSSIVILYHLHFNPNLLKLDVWLFTIV